MPNVALAINYFHKFIYILMLARVIVSWTVRDYTHPLVRMIYDMTEPLLYPMRVLFDKMGWNRGMIDFSFMATWFLIDILAQYLIVFFSRLGM